MKTHPRCKGSGQQLFLRNLKHALCPFCGNTIAVGAGDKLAEHWWSSRNRHAHKGGPQRGWKGKSSK